MRFSVGETVRPVTERPLSLPEQTDIRRHICQECHFCKRTHWYEGRREFAQFCSVGYYTRTTSNESSSENKHTKKLENFTSPLREGTFTLFNDILTNYVVQLWFKYARLCIWRRNAAGWTEHVSRYGCQDKRSEGVTAHAVRTGNNITTNCLHVWFLIRHMLFGLRFYVAVFWVTSVVDGYRHVGEILSPSALKMNAICSIQILLAT